MEKYANKIARAALILGIIALILSVVANYTGEMIEVGHKGWIGSSAVMFLMAIAFNTLKKS